MIKEGILKQVAKRAGIDESQFLTAIKAEGEQDITLEGEGEFITNEDLETIKVNSGKSNYEDGKKAGEEILIKSVKKLAGVEFEGKTPENLFGALKTKFEADAKVEPNTKIQELEKDKKALQEQLEEKDGIIKNKESEIDNLFVQSNVKAKLPEKLENGMTRDDLFILYSAKRKFKRNENGLELVDSKTNEVVKDKKLNPLSVEKDIEEFLQPYGKIPEPGRKGGDNPPRGNNDVESMKKMSEVHEYFEKNDIPLSQQSALLAKAAKNEGFDYNA